MISLWRNDNYQVFKGKYSSGATPKLKQIKLLESPISSAIANKKIKKSLFCNNEVKNNPIDFTKENLAIDFAKENFGDSFNMNLETETSREKTPSPKKRYHEDHYNTMSIKKERKIFDKREDLEMKDDYEHEDYRFMTTSKVKMNNLNEINQCSRFVNDYEIIEVTFFLLIISH